MKKITSKMIVALFIVSCVSAIFTLLISYITVTDIMKQQVSISGITSAEYNAEIIAKWAQEKMASFQRTAIHVENLPAFEEEGIRRMLQSAAEADPSFYSVFLGLEDGKLIDGQGWIPPQTYHATLRPWYRAAKKENRLIFTPLYMDTNKKNVVASIAMPVKIQDKEGVLAANMPIDHIIAQVNQIKFGKTGYGILLDKEGTIISHPLQKYVMKNIQEIFKNESIISLEKIREGRVGVGVFSIHHVKNLVVHVPIQTCNWELLLIAPLSEFQDPVKRMLRYLIMILGISLLLVLFLGYVISRSMIKPIEKMIIEVSKLAKGDLTGDIEEKSKDELGILSEELNSMRKNLINMLQDIQKNSHLLFINTQKLLASIRETDGNKSHNAVKDHDIKEVETKEKNRSFERNNAAVREHEDCYKSNRAKEKKIAGADEVYAIAAQINEIADRLKKGIGSFKI